MAEDRKVVGLPVGPTRAFDTYSQQTYPADVDRSVAFLKDLIARTANTNLDKNRGVYTTGGKEVHPVEGLLTAGGWVDSEYPDQVFMVPDTLKKYGKTPGKTLGHELAHIQQRGGNRPVADFAFGYPDPTSGKPSYQMVKAAYDKYAPTHSLGLEFAQKPKEFWADIQGIEAMLPEGKSIMDTDIGKELFNTRERQKMMFANTLMAHPSMYAGDPASLGERVGAIARAASGRTPGGVAGALRRLFSGD